MKPWRDLQVSMELPKLQGSTAGGVTPRAKRILQQLGGSWRSAAWGEACGQHLPRSKGEGLVFLQLLTVWHGTRRLRQPLAFTYSTNS